MIDFKKIIEELESRGVTTHKLALMMQRQYIQVKRWKNGAQPKHKDGQAILMIYAESVGKDGFNG